MIFAPRKHPRILIVGHGRAGKDEALKWFDNATLYASGGTTSLYLALDVASAKGESVESVYAKRHADREFWKSLGDSLRLSRGILYLLKQALLRGNVVAGVRDIREIMSAVEEGLVDAILWIDNPNVPIDPTMTYGPEDIVSIIDASAQSGARQVFYKSVPNTTGTLTPYHIELNEAYYEIRQWWANLKDSEKI